MIIIFLGKNIEEDCLKLLCTFWYGWNEEKDKRILLLRFFLDYKIWQNSDWYLLLDGSSAG